MDPESEALLERIDTMIKDAEIEDLSALILAIDDRVRAGALRLWTRRPFHPGRCGIKHAGLTGPKDMR